MAKMGISKAEIDEKNITPGIKQVVFQGFKPQKAKQGDSINLYPQLTIVGDAKDNGKNVRYPLNFQASTMFMVENFLHAFGLDWETAPDGSQNIPGDWTQPTADPATWTYNGPLKGKTAKFELVLGEFNGQQQTQVKQMLCALPGCKTKHKDDLK